MLVTLDFAATAPTAVIPFHLLGAHKTSLEREEPLQVSRFRAMYVYKMIGAEESKSEVRSKNRVSGQI